MIRFNPNQHKYFYNDVEYISVTTLIEKFKPDVNWNIIAYNCAIRDLYESLTPDKRQKLTIARLKQKYPINSKIGTSLTKNKLKEWERLKSEAANYGTAVHNTIEHDIITSNKFICPITSETFKVYQKKTPYIYVDIRPFNVMAFTEYIIFDTYFNIAGTADIITKSGNTLSIYDIKTNKEITTDPTKWRSDQHFKYPINHLLASKYNTYALQLSAYAYMMERKGFSINNLVIIHKPKDKSSTSIIQVPYLFNEVKLIFEYYKNNTRTQ